MLFSLLPLPRLALATLNHAQFAISLSAPRLLPQHHLQKMRLTVATEEGSTFNIDVDPGMELENVAALLEADVRKKLQEGLLCALQQLR